MMDTAEAAGATGEGGGTRRRKDAAAERMPQLGAHCDVSVKIY